jgi:hypothetical protein
VRRIASGLHTQLSYTFSRSVDDSSGVNSQDYTDGSPYVIDYYDHKADRGPSSFWAKHVLAGNWSYELPIARSLTGAGGVLLKGWQVNGITTFRSGRPLNVCLQNENAGLGDFGICERPDIVANPILDKSKRTLNEWFNTAAFAQNKVVTGVATDGSSARNLLYGPGYKTVDLAISRNFSLNERFKLTLRGEATNTFNHPNYGQPGASVPAAGTTSASFGVISSAGAMRRLQFGARLTF